MRKGGRNSHLPELCLCLKATKPMLPCNCCIDNSLGHFATVQPEFFCKGFKFIWSWKKIFLSHLQIRRGGVSSMFCPIMSFIPLLSFSFFFYETLCLRRSSMKLTSWLSSVKFFFSPNWWHQCVESFQSVSLLEGVQSIKRGVLWSIMQGVPPLPL